MDNKPSTSKSSLHKHSFEYQKGRNMQYYQNINMILQEVSKHTKQLDKNFKSLGVDITTTAELINAIEKHYDEFVLDKFT